MAEWPPSKRRRHTHRKTFGSLCFVVFKKNTINKKSFINFKCASSSFILERRPTSVFVIFIASELSRLCLVEFFYYFFFVFLSFYPQLVSPMTAINDLRMSVLCRVCFCIPFYSLSLPLRKRLALSLFFNINTSISLNKHNGTVISQFHIF